MSDLLLLSNRKNLLMALSLGCALALMVGCGDLGDLDDDGGSVGLADESNNSSNNFDPGDFNNDDNNDANNDDNNDTGNTNVNLGGAQDFGYFRRLLADNIVPRPEDMEASGFFAEHFTPLPEPDCGEQLCVQAMMGAMGNLVNGSNCTMLQIGLNSPLTVDPDNRPPLNLVVVVDVSGSMAADGKIGFVRQGLQQMLNELTDTDQIAIVTYETRVRVPFEMAPVRSNRNELATIIAGLRPEGSTNLYDGLERGYRQLSSNYDSGRQNRLILLSDGEPTAGITDPEQIIEMSRGYNSDGLGLTTVGLGTDFNINLMRSLAEQADGNFYFVENSAAVEEVFTQELAYFTLPVAFDLTLEMYTGSDFTFGTSRGSRLFEHTNFGGRLEVPSVFLAHRIAHDDVEPDGGRRGGGSALLIELMPREDDNTEPESGHVATITLEFREPGTNRIVEDRVDVTVPFSPWNTPLRGFFENEIVEKSFVMLNIYVALEMACTLFHNQDQPIEAIVVLDRLIAAAEDYEDSANGGEGDVDIQLDIEMMEDLITVILANGGSEPEDSGIEEDPWPAD